MDRKILYNNIIFTVHADANTWEEAYNSNIVRGHKLSISKIGDKYYVVKWYSHTLADYPFEDVDAERIEEDDINSIEILAEFNSYEEAIKYIKQMFPEDC